MALFQPVQGRLERFALAMTRDAEQAKDVVGETILIAFQRFETLRSEQAFLSFLFTIATRVARSHRQKRRTTDLETTEVEALLDPTTPADVVADIGRLYNALQQLPEKQREAVLLFEIAGFSTAEVRDVQGGTLVAVRVRIARGRKRLATLLGVEEPGEPTVTQHVGNDGGGAPAPSTIQTELRTELGIQR